MKRTKSVLFIAFMGIALSMSAQNREKGERKEFSAEEMATKQTEMLKKELNLDSLQEKKVKAIYLKQAQERESQRKSQQSSAQNSSDQQKGKGQKREMKQNDEEIKAILTTEQKEKYESLKKNRPQRGTKENKDSNKKTEK